MQGANAQGVLFVLGAFIAAAAFIGVVFGVNKLLSPRKPSVEKGTPFECGFDQAGQPLNSQNLRFSTVAMLFVLFDAESILLFAVASKLRGSAIALVEVGAFIAFLVLGLAFAWRKGALEWRS
ncbi:MAG TPA: NADH-quinone oxidoreductase subunit A [Coriobacteriia bacterium]|nr:NADH-quinone oxidoreductase subunit A [Coriobacteriia bacterium]